MDEREQEFTLEDIMREFSDAPDSKPVVQQLPPEKEKPQDLSDTIRMQTIKDASAQTVTSDTIRMDTLCTQKQEPKPLTDDTIRLEIPETETVTVDTVRLSTDKLPKGQYKGAAPLAEEPVAEQPKEDEAFTEKWEPEYEQPIGNYVPPQPIAFKPRSELREMKRKLVEGPEKQYYALEEKGLGKLQAAIFLSLLVVLISAGAMILYGFGMVQENRLRLMVFGQFFAMLVSALLVSFQMIDGVTDILNKRFHLNSLLVCTFAVCTVDAVICLAQVRVPCCAIFSLLATMSLWNTYCRRSAEMAQLDTMRKANHLGALHAVENYYEDNTGFVHAEGQVEDFTENYAVPSTPEKVMSVYALSALLVSAVIGVVGVLFHGFGAGVQIMAVSLLAAVPATAFITLSRPAAILQKRLHSLGTVLCGWKGIKKLSQKAVFPITHDDLFPSGTVRMNGVKFYGEQNPDEVISCCASVIMADEGGLAPLFTQLLDNSNGRRYEVEQLTCYEEGGLQAQVRGQTVLVGTISFMKHMGIALPEKLKLSNAVCAAIDGELCALFAVTYQAQKSVAAGLGTLCLYRKLSPIMLTENFTVTQMFLKRVFGVNARKVCIPNRDSCEQMKQQKAQEQESALLVTTSGLAPYAYGVTGARALRTASVIGVAIHITGGVLGLIMMAVLTGLGALQMLTPLNVLLYQLIWLIPGLLITEWTRSI